MIAQCLCHELTLRKLPFARERPLSVVYKGLRLDCAYRLDLLVADAVAVEVKAVECLIPVHTARLPTYLRLGAWKAGLLLNFNVPLLFLRAVSASSASLAVKSPPPKNPVTKV